jgi:hypothetical protein
MVRKQANDLEKWVATDPVLPRNILRAETESRWGLEIRLRRSEIVTFQTLTLRPYVETFWM